MSARRADVAYLASLALGLSALVILGLLELRIERLGSDDFAAIWAGPRAFLEGYDPYDPAGWADLAVRLGAPRPDTAVYIYPPWVVLALSPLALLGPRVAGAVWTIAGMVAAALALRALLRSFLPGAAWAHALAGLLLFVSAPAVVTLLTGQWPFLHLAALVLVVLLLRGHRPVAAGIVAAVMLTKPPLFVFSGVALAVRALWPGGNRGEGRRFVLAAGSAVAAAIAISWAVIPSWWPAYLQYVAIRQLGALPVTIPTLLGTALGPGSEWLAAPMLVGGVFVALRFDPLGAAWLPVWFALSSAATVYGNSYDLLLLIIPLVLGAGALELQSRRRAAVVLVSGAVLLLGVLPVLHGLGLLTVAAIAPLAVFVVVSAALWPQRRAHQVVKVSVVS